MYLAGQVDRSTINFGEIAVGYNPYGIREAGEVNVSTLDLIPGFTGGQFAYQSDQIQDMITGNSAWYNTTTSSWSGSLTNITPGHAYYIYVLSGHSSFDWTYNPTGSEDSKTTVKTIKVKVNKNDNLKSDLKSERR